VLQTLSTAWTAGSLEESYFQKWLTSTNHELERLEQDAAPSGWLCQWDRYSIPYAKFALFYVNMPRIMSMFNGKNRYMYH